MKTVFVFGGNGNLGSSIAEFEALNHSQVYSFDIHPSVHSKHVSLDLNYFQCDLSQPSFYQELASLCFDNDLSIDSLVLAAALDAVPRDNFNISPSRTASQYADGHKMLLTNIAYQIDLIDSLKPFLNPNSHILLFSSIYGQCSPDPRIYPLGFSKPYEYAASKAAILGLTRQIAVNHAAEGLGRANCLILGGVSSTQHNPSFISNYIDKVPLARMANTDDVVNAYSFLSSTSSSYITGTSLTVDGGYTAL